MFGRNKRPAERPRERWHGRARHALRRSLRLRLLLVFLCMALAMAMVFIVGTQRGLGQAWRGAVQPLAADYVDRIVADLGTPPSVERAQALVARLPISIRIEGPRVQWDSHAKQRRYQRGNGWLDDKDGDGDGDGDRFLSRTTADGHRVLLGVGDVPWERGPHRAAWITLALLLAMAGLAYAYLVRLLRPLNDIRAGAQRFGKGDFDTPIAVRRRDELGELAAQVNTMASDIHQMLEGKRALLLAISHELRSPLTRARLNTELLPEEGDAAPLRQALLRDLAEMRDLITDLLEGERLSGSHVALQREPVDLVALVRELMASRADFQVLQHDLPEGPMMLDVDAARVRLALRNLLDNALRHGADAPQPPRLALVRDAAGIWLQVRDHGPGVPQDQLAHLAQAFYRPDSARQRRTGGVGLGLYLARLVAEAHGGQLRLRNTLPGLEATLFLPATGQVPLR